MQDIIDGVELIEVVALLAHLLAHGRHDPGTCDDCDAARVVVDEALRWAEAVDATEGRVLKLLAGRPTVDEMAASTNVLERLAAEPNVERSARVALWGAIEVLRDLIETMDATEGRR